MNMPLGAQDAELGDSGSCFRLLRPRELFLKGQYFHAALNHQNYHVDSVTTLHAHQDPPDRTIAHHPRYPTQRDPASNSAVELDD